MRASLLLSAEIWRGFNAVALQIADDRSVALSIALGTVRDADHMRRFRRSNPGRRNSPQRCVPAHRHSEPVRQARARVAIHGGVCVAPAMTSDFGPLHIHPDEIDLAQVGFAAPVVKPSSFNRYGVIEPNPIMFEKMIFWVGVSSQIGPIPSHFRLRCLDGNQYCHSGY